MAWLFSSRATENEIHRDSGDRMHMVTRWNQVKMSPRVPVHCPLCSISFLRGGREVGLAGKKGSRYSGLGSRASGGALEGEADTPSSSLRYLLRRCSETSPPQEGETMGGGLGLQSPALPIRIKNGLKFSHCRHPVGS